jgi:hypothetical protein
MAHAYHGAGADRVGKKADANPDVCLCDERTNNSGPATRGHHYAPPPADSSLLSWLASEMPDIFIGVLQCLTYKDAGRLCSVSKALRSVMDDPSRDSWEPSYAKEVRMTYPLSLLGAGFLPNSWILNAECIFETLHDVESRLNSKQKTRLRVQLRRWARYDPLNPHAAVTDAPSEWHSTRRRRMI